MGHRKICQTEIPPQKNSSSCSRQQFGTIRLQEFCLYTIYLKLVASWKHVCLLSHLYVCVCVCVCVPIKNLLKHPHILKKHVYRSHWCLAWNKPRCVKPQYRHSKNIYRGNFLPDFLQGKWWHFENQKAIFSPKLLRTFYIKSESHSVVSDSLRPHGLLPTRILCPLNIPDQNIGAVFQVVFQGNRR